MLPIMTKKIEKKSTRSYQGQGLSALWLCFLMFVFGYLAASWFDVNQLVRWVGDRFASRPPVEKVVAQKLEAVKPVREQHPKLEFYTLLTSDAGLHNPPTQLASPETTSINVQYKSVQEKSDNIATGSETSSPMELAVTSPAAESAPKPNPSPFPPQVPVTPSKPATPPRPVLPKPLSDELRPAAVPVSASDRFKGQGRYVIQVASFRSQFEAKKLRERLAQRGYNANIVSIMQQSTYWYRVMVGPFSSLGQAQQAQSALSYQEHIRGMIRKD